MVNYRISNNIIIFGHQYNEPLSPELLSQVNCKKIIFANYELVDGVFKAWKNNHHKGFKYIVSKFNQPLDNSLNNCTSLTHIKFGDNFNQPLHNSLNNCIALTHIYFGLNYNQPLDNSLDNCTALIYLRLSYYFNQKDELPSNIRFLCLNCNNTHYVDYLPNTIEEIEFRPYFNLKLDNLPSTIKKITFEKNSFYNQELNCLPNGLSILKLPDKYYHKIQNIPPRIEKLFCSKDYPYIDDFTGVTVETY